MKDRNYFVHPSSYIDDNVRIGESTKIWHFCHVQSGASIGRDCSLGQNVYIGSNVKIGDGTRMQNNVFVCKGVEIENNVFCGPSVSFTNVKNPRARFPVNGSYTKTLVREGATIGANAAIVCGHIIGSHAFVGAGAVVTEDVKDYAMVAGVPSRQRGWVCECGRRLDETNKCGCGRSYRLEGDCLKKDD